MSCASSFSSYKRKDLKKVESFVDDGISQGVVFILYCVNHMNMKMQNHNQLCENLLFVCCLIIVAYCERCLSLHHFIDVWCVLMFFFTA